ncbi:MAG: glycosyltransferase family 4 protein [Bacteroidota bacterium]
MKKVLIVAYYWPPSAGSGVQRWLKMVKYLRDFGWEPIVLTPSNPDFNLQDPGLLADIPKDIQVLRLPILEPFALYNKFMGQKDESRVNPVFSDPNRKPKLKERFALWVRSNLFIPDARMMWIRPASKYLINWLKDNPVDAMVTTGPPHSMHLIGLRVKKATGIPWLADFRDPWTRIDFYRELNLEKWADQKHHRLEREVSRTADALVVIGNTMREEYESLTVKPVAVITNGYDDADFSFKDAAPEPDKEFSIVHVGMLGKARNHPVFWEALQELRNEYPPFARDLKIKFYGKADPAVEASVKQYNAESWVKFYPYMSHAEIIQVQRRAQVLLLSVNNTHNARGILTGKIFEYLAIQRPILAIGPTDGDAAAILRDTAAGLISGFSDKETLKQHITRYYSWYKTGTLKVDNSGTEKYSRRNLAGRMAGMLNLVSTPEKK